VTRSGNKSDLTRLLHLASAPLILPGARHLAGVQVNQAGCYGARKRGVCPTKRVVMISKTLCRRLLSLF
jgi:hypothetical protein